MIGRRLLPETCLRWNERWGAPFGRGMADGLSLKGRLRHPARGEFGPFAFQWNNTTRIFEYPWAYHAAQVVPGMRVMEVGGGLSGLQFVLDLEGCEVVNVDPGSDGAHSWPNSATDHDLLNQTFQTHVTLVQERVEALGHDAGTYDRVFCISVIEHVPPDSAQAMMRSMARLLKPGGLCVMTVDLFLDVYPFTEKRENSLGMNADVHALVAESGLELVSGYTDELHGFPEFDHRKIRSRADEFYEGRFHALAQALVLRKCPD